MALNTQWDNPPWGEEWALSQVLAHGWGFEKLKMSSMTDKIRTAHEDVIVRCNDLDNFKANDEKTAQSVWWAGVGVDQLCTLEKCIEDIERYTAETGGDKKLAKQYI